MSAIFSALLHFSHEKEGQSSFYGIQNFGLCEIASNSYEKQAFSIDTSINHFEMLKEGDEIIATATEESLKNKLGFIGWKLKRKVNWQHFLKGQFIGAGRSGRMKTNDF